MGVVGADTIAFRQEPFDGFGPVAVVVYEDGGHAGRFDFIGWIIHFSLLELEPHPSCGFLQGKGADGQAGVHPQGDGRFWRASARPRGRRSRGKSPFQRPRRPRRPMQLKAAAHRVATHNGIMGSIAVKIAGLVHLLLPAATKTGYSARPRFPRPPYPDDGCGRAAPACRTDTPDPRPTNQKNSAAEPSSRRNNAPSPKQIATSSNP